MKAIFDEEATNDASDTLASKEGKEAKNEKKEKDGVTEELGMTEKSGKTESTQELGKKEEPRTAENTIESGKVNAFEKNDANGKSEATGKVNAAEKTEASGKPEASDKSEASPKTEAADKTEKTGKSQEPEKGKDAKASGEISGKKKILLISLIAILVLAGAGIGGWFYIDSLAYKVCRVEAGVAVTPSDFLKNADENAFFTEDSQSFDISEPGEYHVKVKSGFFTHNCTLIIEDTIAPAGEGQTVQMEIGSACEAEMFVANVSDATAVTISFAAQPDFTKAGEQPVQVVLEDKGGNRTAVDAVLFITQVMETVTVEAGQEAPGLDSFVIAGQDAAFITDINEIDYTKIGEYKVSVAVDGTEYTSTLQVADTIPPQVQVRDVEGYALMPRTVEEFVVSVEDVTEVTAAFKEEPDLNRIGTQEVEIVFTDGGGNETVVQAKLTLLEDTEAPVIVGAGDLTVYVGDGIPYRKNVSVSDNCPEGAELTVDSGAVNADVPGVYPVIYTARDLAGNTSSVTINLTVKSREFNPDEVYVMADEVLAEILNDGMSDLEKVTAIYDYVKGHIGYVSHSEKGDWLKAAYEGLSTGKGDCYTYAHTSSLLLDRAGIKNMIIEKIPAKTRHVWNLVDIGDGWYHFDACPRRGLTEKVLMWTDEKLMEYSDSHNKSHNYDRTVYTDIN